MHEGIVHMTPAVQISSGIGIALLILIAFLGNGLTVIAYVTNKKLHSVYNFYIFNLAVADLLISSLSMPIYAVYTLLEFTWPFGYAFCKVWSVIDYTLCFETIVLMLILSLDRLFLVYFGPRYTTKMTLRIAYFEIAISWLISFFAYGPAIIGWDHWVGYSTVEPMDCDVEFAHDNVFTTTTAVIEFVLPFVLMTTLNAIIFFKINRRNKVAPLISSIHSNTGGVKSGISRCKSTTNKLKELTSPNDIVPSSSTTSAGNAQNVPGRLTSNKTPPRDSKVAKLLTSLVATFLLLWAPYSITTVIISFCEACYNYSLYEFFVWLLWVKCAVNPFLYAFNSLQYRNSFRKLIARVLRRPL